MGNDPDSLSRAKRVADASSLAFLHILEPYTQRLLLFHALSMVFVKISPDRKECALRLWEAGWLVPDICYVLLVSGRSLYRWRNIFEEFGTVTKPRSFICGRPRILGLAALTAIRDIYRRHPDTYLDELVWWLALHHNTIISVSALQENLEKGGAYKEVAA